MSSHRIPPKHLSRGRMSRKWLTCRSWCCSASSWSWPWWARRGPCTGTSPKGARTGTSIRWVSAGGGCLCAWDETFLKNPPKHCLRVVAILVRPLAALYNARLSRRSERLGVVMKRRWRSLEIVFNSFKQIFKLLFLSYFLSGITIYVLIYEQLLQINTNLIPV